MKFRTGSLIALVVLANATSLAAAYGGGRTRASSPIIAELSDDTMPSTVKLPKGFSKVAGLSWTDTAGDHYALFTSKTTEVKSMHSIYLQVDVYDGAAGKPLKLTRSVKDLSENVSTTTPRNLLMPAFYSGISTLIQSTSCCLPTLRDVEVMSAPTR